jgi:hypothetical protein
VARTLLLPSGTTGKEATMFYILAWLLGVPLGLIILLWLLGIGS